MFEQLATRPEQRQVIRRAPALEGDREHSVALLKRAVTASFKENLDWDGEVSFSLAEPFDREKVERQRAEVNRLFGAPRHQLFNYTLWPGWQVIVPQYDDWWGEGSAMPWSHFDGGIQVIGSDGFSGAGFAINLEADEEGYASIVPQGPVQASWASFEHLPDLRSKAGAGVVVYQGNNLLVSRQPVIWDVRGPYQGTGQTFEPDFGQVASPPVAGTFGTVPLSPVIAPIGPGKPLLVWFYLWHIGAKMEGKAFWPFVFADVPMVFVNFGKGPIVN